MPGDFGRVVDCNIRMKEQRDGRWCVTSRDVNERGEEVCIQAVVGFDMTKEDAAYLALILSSPVALALHAMGKLKRKEKE